MEHIEKIRKRLEEDLPPIIARSEVGKYTGGLYSPRTLANEDSKGTGVKNSFKLKGDNIRGHVGYLKEDFIEWLLAKISP